MYGPVRKCTAGEETAYVNVTLVTHVEPGKPQRAKFAKNEEWPTSWIHVSGSDIDKGLHVFGAPEQILQSWFGPGEQKSSPEPKSNIVVPGMKVNPRFDPRGRQ